MEPIFDFSIDDVIAFFETLFGYFKKIMAWIGILVLPEPGEYDHYPSQDVSDDPAVGA